MSKLKELYNEISNYKAKTKEEIISERLERNLARYISDLDSAYSRLSNYNKYNKNKKKLFKEVNK